MPKALVLAAIVLALPASAPAQTPVPAVFHGDWVPAGGPCEAGVRLRVTAISLTLSNGADSQTWEDIGIPSTYFGPDYPGISVVALPDFDGVQPFTVFFNVDEQEGVTKVSILAGVRPPMNPTLAAIEARAKALAARFPLDNLLLKKC